MALTDNMPMTVAGFDFDSLVSQYYRPLYQFAIGLTHSGIEAADLTQQVFYILARKGNQVRDPAKVKTWLFTVLHREFLKTRRRQTRFPHLELGQAERELPTVSPEVVDQLDGTFVLEALARVDELYRAPLALFYLEDNSYKEIAEVLDVPIGTVQSRLARGKAQLYRLLSGNDPSAIKQALRVSADANEAQRG